MAGDGFVDFMELSHLYSEEEKTLRQKVKDFVDREAMPVIARFFDKAAFPLELIPKMAAMGLFGVHVRGYGCRPATHLGYGLICQELGRCDSGLRALFSVQNSLAMLPIDLFGTEEQKQKWLPQMAKGDAIGCFGLSEPGFGSNPGGMETRAEKKGGAYLLNGHKMWITNGAIAHVAVIWAKTDGVIRGFLVEKGTPGFKSAPIRRKFSYRTSPTAALHLKNCLIPEENLLPGTRGLKSILQCLNHARYGVACSALGSAMACFEAAKTFARHRRVFDRPLASCQLVQDQLVRMISEITKAQLLAYHVGKALDEGRAKPAQISLAKQNNVREAMTIARMARDILGARGILADHQVIRHLCDLEALSTLEGTHSIHTLIIGKEITGLSAF